MKIFITGATSGIGAELTRLYAAPGVTLGLVGRRRDRLDAMEKLAVTRGAKVYTYQIDVSDGPAVQKSANHFLKTTGHIDLVIANAGIGGWRHPADDEASRLTEVIDTNVNGVIYTVMAFVPAMIHQRSGQIVAVSSIASFVGLPRGAYAASKAAVRYLMDGWRIDLAPYGISVTTIFPGFVASEMTAREGVRYPFLVSAPVAGARIQGAIQRKARHLIFPWPWRIILPIAKFTPDWLWRRFIPSQ